MKTARRKEASMKQFIKDNTLLRRESAQAQRWQLRQGLDCLFFLYLYRLYVIAKGGLQLRFFPMLLGTPPTKRRSFWYKVLARTGLAIFLRGGRGWNHNVDVL